MPSRRHLVLAILLLMVLIAPRPAAAADNGLADDLRQLVADTRQDDQTQASRRWQTIVQSASAADLITMLEAFDATEHGERVANNWLRAAIDAVAERALADNGTLPARELEKFVLADENPRARRVAYEWLAKIDSSAPDRMLPQMLDDLSLELRYDAIARLLADADSAQEGEKLAKYQRAFESVRDKNQFQQAAEALKALGQTPDMAGQLGFLTQWKVVGPFDNLDRKGFAEDHFSPVAVDPADEYAGKNGKVHWQDADAELEDFDNLGTVDFNKAFVEEKSLLGYALTTFVSTEDQPVEIRYESKSATRLWVNGREVATKDVYHSGGGFDQYIVPCQFASGPNSILIKVCQNEQTEPWTKPWEFRLRVTDSHGAAVRQAQ